ncbi:EYxxD motif small membrane protein [Bacillus sp. DNRA2]
MRRRARMIYEYITDMSFVLITLIGSIIALYYVYGRKPNKER